MEDDEARDAADRQFRQAVEQNLQSLNRLVADHAKAIGLAAHVQLGQHREAFAVDRALLALAIEVAKLVPDRGQYVDQLRKGALDKVPLDDEGSTDGMREPLELLLAQIEAAVQRLPPP